MIERPDPTDRPKTIEEVKAYILASLPEGCDCPCCGRRIKLYRRRLNSGMARCLIWLVKEFQKTGQWTPVNHDAPSYALQNREWGRFADWGLAVEKENDDPGRAHSGLWKPTDVGVEFVEGRGLTWKSLDFLLGRVVARSDLKISIWGALGKRFDYEELMKGG